MLLGAPPTLPVLEVRRATYGHVADLSKTFDVTTEVRRIAESQGGFRLDITKDDDLAALFRDPCRGIRKKLSISCVILSSFCFVSPPSTLFCCFCCLPPLVRPV